MVYNQNNQIVSKLDGDARFTQMPGGTNIVLADTTTGNHENALVHVLFDFEELVKSPSILDPSKFEGAISKGYFQTYWRYEANQGTIEITEVWDGYIRGEFSIKAKSTDSMNNKWGDDITIKGKFNARCVYGC